MALIKSTLQQSLFSGLQKILLDQASKATSGDEQEDPKSVVKQVSYDVANVIADAIDAYVKSGDIIVGATNVQVTSTTPGTPATVAPLRPAKMK